VAPSAPASEGFFDYCLRCSNDSATRQIGTGLYPITHPISSRSVPRVGSDLRPGGLERLNDHAQGIRADSRAINELSSALDCLNLQSRLRFRSARDRAAFNPCADAKHHRVTLQPFIRGPPFAWPPWLQVSRPSSCCGRYRCPRLECAVWIGRCRLGNAQRPRTYPGASFRALGP
jgi:hypothetical protein